MKQEKNRLLLAVFFWAIVGVLIATLPLTIRGMSPYPPLTLRRNILSIIFWTCMASSLSVRNRLVTIAGVVAALIVAAVGLFVE